ncbi:MAG: FtsQ-type POTRA domain-containing protein [Actinomycetota bacterium]|nr:FtsQ-type POTRA domain-containing protein [Actinomycetota bacterium]
MSTATRIPRAEAPEPPADRAGGLRAYAGGHRRTLILVGLAVAVAVILLGWVVAFSSVLGVKSVTVRGTQLSSIAQVRAAAAIGRGTPLVRLDPASIARRVEALPAVQSASVGISYPNTVVITVVERVALGYLQSGSQFVLVDRTGDQFRTVQVRPRALPLFAIPPGPEAKATGEALASVAASLPSELLARIASIQGFDPHAITLLLTDQRVVSWGSADHNAEKARVLPTLLSQPGTQFNVTNPTQVFAH